MENDRVTLKDMINSLNVADSTLRKWCIALEKEGYLFEKTKGNHRSFNENDLIVLNQLRTLIQEHDFTLKNAAKVVISGNRGKSSISGTDEITIFEDRKITKTDVENLVLKLEESLSNNARILERMDEQDLRDKERLEKQEQRDKERNEKFDQLMRSLQEQKEEANKKGLFSRWLKRK